MAKGENIFKRKDGRWEARYIKGYELSGKIRYGFCYGKTYKEAKDKVTKSKAALVSGVSSSNISNKHRFGYYCDEWLKTSKSKIKESTYVKYESVVNRHIKPKLGGCYPQGLTTSLIDAFTSELLDATGLAPGTVKTVLVLLRSILKYTQKYAGINMQVEINTPREIKMEMRVLSRDEQARFVHFLTKEMDECKFGVLLALNTGIRIGELCALKWEDISLDEGIMHIRTTMQRIKYTTNTGYSKTRVVIGAPKSYTSTRTIPLAKNIWELCQIQGFRHPESYILTGTEQYMEPRTLQYRLKKYTNACGLEGVHFHTLRHTFATRCVEVGFEIKSLSEILGHSSTTITLDRYVHSSMDLKRDNMTKLATIGF